MPLSSIREGVDIAPTVEPHSEIVKVSEAVPSATQQTVTFSDGEAGWSTEVAHSPDSTFQSVSTANTDLGTFLGRPVIVHQHEWVIGAEHTDVLNPWKLFFENPAVTEKIKYYELIKCDLRIKVVISGTSFHYGRIMVSYNPMGQLAWKTEDIASPLTENLIQLSQRPHIFLNPSTNEGGELFLPYFWPNNYMSVTRADWDNFGELSFRSFGPLFHANDALDNVNLTVYAWAENVTLTMPTSQPPGSLPPVEPHAMNSDEYGKGIVSRPASAVASAAGRLATVPVIGPYMRATQIGASALSKIASLFGYARPQVITPIQQVKQLGSGNHANADASDAPLKLSFDSKNEVTIDPRTVGLGGDDEMTIDSIIQRESYLTSFSWDPADIEDSILWNCRVTPQLYSTDTATQDTPYHLTPLALMAEHFLYWKGPIIFRFQIVKSGFHRGRLNIRYDPNVNPAAVDYNRAYHRVVDIAEEEDFEIEIGWAQAQVMLRVPEITNADQLFSPDKLGSRSLGYGFDNGILELDVMNKLVTPKSTAPISINVYVKAGPGFMLGSPSPYGPEQLTPYPDRVRDTARAVEPHSGDLEPESEDKPGSAEPIEAIAPSATPDQFCNVFMGEHVTSLRQMFKRYYFERTDFYTPDAATPTTFATFYSLIRQDRPLMRGFDPNGQDSITDGEIGAAPATVAGVTPLALWPLCFAAQRGGFRRKVLIDGNSKDQCLRVSRGGKGIAGTDNIALNKVNFTDDESRSQAVSSIRNRYSHGGSAMTPIALYPNLEFDMPFYNRERFINPRVDSQDVYSNRHIIEFGVDDEQIVLNTYVASSEDFSLFFFTGIPPLYKYEMDSIN